MSRRDEEFHQFFIVLECISEYIIQWRAKNNADVLLPILDMLNKGLTISFPLRLCGHIKDASWSIYNLPAVSELLIALTQIIS